MEIIYRKAIESDLVGINRLLDINFNHVIDNVINTDDKYFLVGVIDEQIVALSFITKTYNDVNKKYWYKINYVCVDEKYRGNHIALHLMEEIEIQAKEDNVSYLELTSNNKRVAAQALYQRSGFTLPDTCLFRKEIRK